MHILSFSVVRSFVRSLVWPLARRLYLDLLLISVVHLWLAIQPHMGAVGSRHADFPSISAPTPSLPCRVSPFSKSDESSEGRCSQFVAWGHGHNCLVNPNGEAWGNGNTNSHMEAEVGGGSNSSDAELEEWSGPVTPDRDWPPLIGEGGPPDWRGWGSGAQLTRSGNQRGWVA